jgi:glycosyltransferase involved in cell wall biosynthesis
MGLGQQLCRGHQRGGGVGPRDLIPNACDQAFEQLDRIDPMRILFLWWTYESFFADCWQALARRPGVDLHIIAKEPDPNSIAPHSAALLQGLSTRLAPAASLQSNEWIDAQLRELKPDIVCIPGWFNDAYARVVARKDRPFKVIMFFDTPWRGTLRQRIAGVLRHRMFRRVDHAILAGERSRALAVHLGIPEARITLGMCSINTRAWNTSHAQRIAAGPWPKAFVFVGRMVEQKGVDTLIEAYAQYRAMRQSLPGEPWPLEACGKGPLEAALTQAGARVHGFKGPSELRELFARSGVFILPSRHEPWGVVIAEASAAGLPIICTHAVSASIDFVRSCYNGWVIPAGDARALAKAMLEAEKAFDQLPAMGARSLSRAEAYDAEFWADRVLTACRGMLSPSP